MLNFICKNFILQKIKICTYFCLQSNFVYDNITSENQKKKEREFFMEKLNLKTRKNQKGITLVALVITIALNRCRGGHI